MSQILVTGANGQLGRTIQRLSHDFPELSFGFKTSKVLDITKPSQLVDALKNKQYDFCINCAAYTNVEEAEKHPDKAFAINAEGVKNLAKVCKKHQTTLIHISTDYIFDGQKEGGYTVKDKTNPINVYGRSKLAGEKFIRQIGPTHYIIRTSWLYSKKYGHNFYRTVLLKAKKGEELRITDEQRGCPTNTETLVKFILNQIIDGKKPPGTYHVTGGIPMTWYDFAKTILKENGLEKNTKLVLDRNYRTFAARPKNSVLI